MSVAALNQRILAAKADNTITLEEARDILAPNDPFFKAPAGVGHFVDGFEHKAIAQLVNDVKSTDLEAGPRAIRTLEKAADKGPDSRFKHILSKIFGPSLGAVVGAVPGFIAGGFSAVAALMALGSGGAVPVAGIAIWFGITALGGLIGASIGGAIEGALDD